MLTSISNASKIQVPGELFYEQDIYGKDLTVMQAKSLQRLSLTMDIRGIISLLGENLNYDIKKIYFDDFKYILHWFRLNSFKDFPRVIEWYCPFCNKKQSTAVTSSNLIIDDVPDMIKGKNGVLLKLDNYPKGLTIRPPKIGDEFISDALMKKLQIPEEDVDTKSMLLDLNLFRNKENGMDIEALWQEFKNNKFTSNDLMAIWSFKDKCTWGVQDKYKFNCEYCKEEVMVNDALDITTFFQPSESERYFRERILSDIPTETTDK